MNAPHITNHVVMRKNMYVGLAALLLLAGCGKKPESAVELTEPVIETGEVPFTEPAIDVASETESEAEVFGAETDADEISVVNNGGYFVQYGEKVYFHVPDVEGMTRTALWGNFMSNESNGETVLMSVDVNGDDASAMKYDTSFGKMYMSGDCLVYMDYDYPNDIPVQSTHFLNLADDNAMEPEFALYTQPFLGGDAEGHYVATCEYLPEDTDYYKAGFVVSCFKDGAYLGDYEIGTSMQYVGIARNLLLYMAWDEENDLEVLKQLDMETGEVLSLGEAPEFEYGGFEIGQVEFNDERAYVSFANYEGTGHFYYDSKIGIVELGVEDSMQVIDGEAQYAQIEGEEDGEPIGPRAFYVQNGEVIFCDGKPGSADVELDAIGYYDETGSFVAVAQGYGLVYADDAQEIMVEVEQAELVGNAIYLVKNTAEHCPEEDIGWRYAYRRTNTQVIRIDVDTQEEVVLYEISLDKG